jgi:hypothetical protein
MNTLEQIQDYFENVATINKDLLHNSGDRKAFSRLNTEEHITEIKKKASANILVIAAVNGQTAGTFDDKQIRRGISLIIASRADTKGNAGDAITAAHEKAEEIMFDIISRLEFDQETGCGLNFDLDKLSWDDIEGPWLENYYGWMLFIPFRGYLSAYNPEKWTAP